MNLVGPSGGASTTPDTNSAPFYRYDNTDTLYVGLANGRRGRYRGMVAATFERPGKCHQRAFEIAGGELSMAGLAKALSRAAGHDVEYWQARWGEFEAQSGPDIATMYRWFHDEGYAVDISAVQQEYPKLMPFDHWLNENWHSATRTA